MNAIQFDKKSMLQVARLDDMREDWKKACKEYQEIADLFPGDPYVLEPLARVQQKLGLTSDWQRTLSKAIECYRVMGMTNKAEQLQARLFGLTVTSV